MSALVVDASAVVELLLRTSAGRGVATELRNESVASPGHMDAEVLSALARLARTDRIERSLVAPALAELSRSPIVRYPPAPLLGEAWSLRDNVAMRDALYVVLARRLGARLLTADRPLARTDGLGVTVTLVGS